jgi:hypothetical protein
MEARFQTNIPGEIMPCPPQAKDTVLNQIALAPEFNHPAVARCCKAWNLSFKANLKAGTDPVLIYVRANEAYRFAMPPLSTPESLCDYVACVAHGVVLNIIPLVHAAAMMDAARVASGAFRIAANPARTYAAPRKNRKNKIPGSETVDLNVDVLETITYAKETLPNSAEFDQKSA